MTQYKSHNYMGEFADDAAANAFISSAGWDDGGTPREGMKYYNTTNNILKVYLFDAVVGSASWKEVVSGYPIYASSNGSAAAPVYTFSGDRNTGTYRSTDGSGNDLLGIATGAINRVSISSGAFAISDIDNVQLLATGDSYLKAQWTDNTLSKIELDDDTGDSGYYISSLESISAAGDDVEVLLNAETSTGTNTLVQLTATGGSGNNLIQLDALGGNIKLDASSSDQVSYFRSRWTANTKSQLQHYIDGGVYISSLESVSTDADDVKILIDADTTGAGTADIEMTTGGGDITISASGGDESYFETNWDSGLSGKVEFKDDTGDSGYYISSLETVGASNENVLVSLNAETTNTSGTPSALVIIDAYGGSSNDIRIGATGSGNPSTSDIYIGSAGSGGGARDIKIGDFAETANIKLYSEDSYVDANTSINIGTNATYTGNINIGTDGGRTISMGNYVATTEVEILSDSGTDIISQADVLLKAQWTENVLGKVELDDDTGTSGYYISSLETVGVNDEDVEVRLWAETTQVTLDPTAKVVIDALANDGGTGRINIGAESTSMSSIYIGNAGSGVGGRDIEIGDTSEISELRLYAATAYLEASTAINIGTIVSEAGDISIGTAAVERDITVGNTTDATQVIVQSGTGNTHISSEAGVIINAEGSASVEGVTGVDIGTKAAYPGDINIGTVGSRSIAIGNASGTPTSVSIYSGGAGDINISSDDTFTVSADGQVSIGCNGEDNIYLSQNSETRLWVKTTGEINLTPSSGEDCLIAATGTGGIDLDSANYITLDATNNITLEFDSAFGITQSSSNRLAVNPSGAVDLTASSGQDCTLNVAGGGSAIVDGGDFKVDTDTLYVDATNHRVGIGQDSPAEVLDIGENVEGATNFVRVNADHDENCGVKFSTSASASRFVKTAIVAEGVSSYHRANLHFVVDTAGDSNDYVLGTDTKLFIDAYDGHVGIGTTDPGSLLVVKEEKTSGPTIAVADLDSPDHGISMGNFGTGNNIAGNSLILHSGDGGSLVYTCDGGTTYQWWVNNPGSMYSPYTYAHSVTGRNVYINSAGLFGYNSSSREMKRDIQSLTDVSWLMDLEPVSYKYREDKVAGAHGEGHFGLIAEDVAEIKAELVSFDDDVPVTVMYEELIAPLLVKVQQLERQLQTLEG